MSEYTKIEWATHTFNPWEGCQKVGIGCDNCYAEARNARFAGGTAINWGPGAPRRRTSAANWAKPYKWNDNHEAYFAEHGHRQRVFCASLADVFDNAVDIHGRTELPVMNWRGDLFALIMATPNLDWLLLTKRIGNVNRMVPLSWLKPSGWPPNVWLGATIVNQEEADRDIPKLLEVPAAKRFLSMEPLLGPVNLTDVQMPESGHGHHEYSPIVTGNALKRADPSKPKIDWVIVGGESGPNARPMHPDWARSLRDQCQAAGVPFMFKQWGNWRPAAWFDGPDADADCGDAFVDLERTKHVFVANDGRTWDTAGGRWMYPPLPLGHWCLMFCEGKKAAGRTLDVRTWDGVPT